MREKSTEIFLSLSWNVWIYILKGSCRFKFCWEITIEVRRTMAGLKQLTPSFAILQPQLWEAVFILGISAPRCVQLTSAAVCQTCLHSQLSSALPRLTFLQLTRSLVLPSLVIAALSITPCLCMCSGAQEAQVQWRIAQTTFVEILHTNAEKRKPK